MNNREKVIESLAESVVPLLRDLEGPFCELADLWCDDGCPSGEDPEPEDCTVCLLRWLDRPFAGDFELHDGEVLVIDHG